jgi:hypothetical protein
LSGAVVALRLRVDHNYICERGRFRLMIEGEKLPAKFRICRQLASRLLSALGLLSLRACFEN